MFVLRFFISIPNYDCKCNFRFLYCFCILRKEAKNAFYKLFTRRDIDDCAYR